MPRLIPCPSCCSHVLVDERECPHCGIALRTTTAPRVPVVLLGLALAGCPGDDTNTTMTVGEPEYGVPATDSVGTAGTATDTGNSTTASSISASGDVEYGAVDTFLDEPATDTDGSTGSTGTDSTGSTGTDGSATVGEPEYGVPTTGTTT